MNNNAAKQQHQDCYTKKSLAPTGLSAGDKAVLHKYQGSTLYQVGRDYSTGKLSIENLEEFVYQKVNAARGKCWSDIPRWLHTISQLFINPQLGVGAYKIGQQHYDIGNDLFEAMLDGSMSYTCGHWKDCTTLQQAQERKLELICRKLHLKRGQRVLDVGCGWGNFAEFAARNYGVEVFGVTVSQEQAHYASQRCKGLPVRIELCDYTEIKDTFDRIVSIEMIEAVGRKNLPKFFQCMHRSLKPDGIFVLQAISADTFSWNSNPNFDAYVAWIRENIFPDGYLPSLQELVKPHKGDFIIHHLESFGHDYAHTLRAWRSNFETAWSHLSADYSEEFRRVWNYYLAGCAAVFRADLLQLYQVVFTRASVASQEPDPDL